MEGLVGEGIVGWCVSEGMFLFLFLVVVVVMVDGIVGVFVLWIE